jgi:tRNA (guanine-N(7)-)-methyltransferase subunit TRM82
LGHGSPSPGNSYRNPVRRARASPVRCAVVDDTFTYLASCGDDKLLSLWRIDGLQLLNQRYSPFHPPLTHSSELPKRPTAIEFTKHPQAIVISDKFGDVFRFVYITSTQLFRPLHPLSYPLEYTPLSEKQKRDALSSHENPSDGTLVLGHTSVLTSLLLSKDQRYIITADRDVRVSWHPQGFVVEMYYLGHER